jgi:phage terminase large subunit
LRKRYTKNPDQFIDDWGMIYEPRSVEIAKPTVIPFVLYPRQRERIAWVLERWRARESGINDKSREMGVSWLAIAMSVTPQAR